jgi:hypothetical protein
VSQPGDVPQAFGVGKLDAERDGDIKAVRPVLGQPRRRQRGGLDRTAHPRDGLLWAGATQRVRRLAPGPLPPHEYLRGCGPLTPYRLGRALIHRVPGDPAQAGGQADVGHRGRDRFLGLSQVQHHVRDRPPGGPRLRRPLPLVQPDQDVLQPVLLGH